jgi:hypothetical protein
MDLGKAKVGLKKFIVDGKEAIFFLGKLRSDRKDGWKFRRQLIFGGYRLSVAMILFGALTFIWDTQVSNTLIVSGTSMISIILTSYVASATYEDAKIKTSNKEIEP